MEGKVVTASFSFGWELGSGSQLLEFKFNTDWVSNPCMPCQPFATTKKYNWPEGPKHSFWGQIINFLYINIYIIKQFFEKLGDCPPSHVSQVNFLLKFSAHHHQQQIKLLTSW